MSRHFIGTLVKKGDKAELSTGQQKVLYDRFIQHFPEGTRFEICVNVQGKDASASQISKVHAMIRHLANQTGHTFNQMKLLVKNEAGLCYVFHEDGEQKLVCKSFGDDCDSDDINMAIKAIEEIEEKMKNI